MRKGNKGQVIILAGLLMVALLTGCGKKEKESISVEKGTVSANSIVIAVGKHGVKYSKLQNYCYLMKQQYENNFGEQVWDYSLSKSETIGSQAKEEIVNMVTQLEVICAQAKEQKIELSNDEKDEALQKAEEIMENASEKDKSEYCLTVSDMAELYEENILANKMFYIATDAADTNVSDEEAKQITVQYLQIATKSMSENGVEIILDESEKKTAFERAKKLQKQAGKEADFFNFAKENGDNETVELTIGRDSEQLGTAVKTQAFTLKSGQISPVIEGEDGYYIIYCVSDYEQDATYERKEAIIAERQTKMFQEKYEKWLGNYEVSISESFWKVFEL